MKSLATIFILFLLFITACKKVNSDCNRNTYPEAATQEWFKSVNGSKEEAHGHFILTLSDGNFIQVGETGFLPDTKILVVKLAQNGSVIWKRELSSGRYNLGNSVIETKDGYLVCSSISENSSLFLLDKSTGVTLQQKSFDLGGTDAFENIAKTALGYAAIGYTRANDNQNTFFTEGKGHLTLLNDSYEILKQVSLEKHLAHAYRVIYFEKSLFIAGLTEDAQDYCLLKLDRDGNVIWQKTLGGNNSDHCFGMDINDKGDIFLTGHTLSGTENWDTYTIKVNQDGNVLWQKTTGNPRGFNPKYIHDEAWDLKATKDGGCVVVAGTGDEYKRYRRRCGSNGDNSNTWHAYVIKYNDNGIVEWEQTYGDPNGGDWAGEAIDLTLDGGLIIAVDNGQFGFLKLSNIN